MRSPAEQAKRDRAEAHVDKMMETREDDFDLAKWGEDAAHDLHLGRYGASKGVVMRKHAPPWLRAMLVRKAERWGKA